MAFFDTLGKTLSEKGKEAAKKAKDLTETMQLKPFSVALKNPKPGSLSWRIRSGNLKEYRPVPHAGPEFRQEQDSATAAAAGSSRNRK